MKIFSTVILLLCLTMACHRPYYQTVPTNARPCLACGATGQLTCIRCQGSGLGMMCYTCQGAGRIYSYGTWYKCFTCGGRGYLKCNGCNGRGLVRCQYCNGRGYK